MKKKPLGRRNYGHIPHLPDSRMGPGDHKCQEGHARIATVKVRDRNDEIFVQEKLDGSNVGVARVGDQLYPLGRAGWLAISSPFWQHKVFHAWALHHSDRFMDVLHDGERLVGEWLMQAHGTQYDLFHEPFVAFDLMTEDKRLPYDQFIKRLGGLFVTPHLIHRGESLSVAEALSRLDTFGHHGSLDIVEGAIWRVERDRLTGNKGRKNRVVDFLVKYVRPSKKDGVYLPEISGNEPIWNWHTGRLENES